MLTYRKSVFLFLVILLLCVTLLLSISQSSLVMADESQGAPEIFELRGSNSKTYQLPDGTYKWVGYADNIHYRDQNGYYQDINNTIITENKKIGDVDYIYKNASNSYTVRFSNNAADNYFVIMEYQGKTLAFGLTDSNATNAVKLEKIDSVDSKILSNTVDAQSCIVYKDVYQDIDLIYESKTYGLKEYIVLKRPTGKNEFYFNIKMDGLKVKEENGSIVFVDKDDNAIFYIEQPFAIDNNEVITEDVKYTIVESNGAYQIKITIDKAYLTDASRAYPIVIDPSVMITGALTTYDSYVSSKYPDTNYYLNYYLRTGRDSDYYIPKFCANRTLTNG